MTTLYRVLPYAADSAKGAAGHPLYIPPTAGAGRVDGPEYDVLYLGDDPVCAVAEAFGALPVWGPGMLRGLPTLPHSVRALATYELASGSTICDLDDAATLLDLDIRPSRVVTRDREVTQGWASRIHRLGRHVGVRWWSYYNPDWGSLGLWDIRRLRVVGVTALDVTHPALIAAAEAIVRRIV
ncbi:MAG TPA: RES family NAD+ phosphorylase [Microbacteriaceae bacterium]|nr:RES family NAD+ phosphorylase [Microbacteriaceae bacterium]